MRQSSEERGRQKSRYPADEDDYHKGRQRATKRQKSSDEDRKHKKKHKKHNKSRSRSHKKKKNKDNDRSREKVRNEVSEENDKQDRGRNQKKKKKKHSRSSSNDRKKNKKKRSQDRKQQMQRSQVIEKISSKFKEKFQDDVKQSEKSKQRKSRQKKSRQRKQKKKKQKNKSKERSVSDEKYRDRSYEKDRYRYRSRSHEKKRDRRDDRRNDYRQDYYRRDDRKKRDFRRKDNFRFDSPPKSDESDMSDDPEKMEQLAQLKAAKQLVSSKADRKLYLGNLPPNITSQQLMDMLNSALKKMEINTEAEGDSIVSAWISPDGVGHYAFVEFRSAQQATNGLALNGASLFGYQLKLGRPKQYIEYNKALLSEMGTDRNMDTILKKVAAFGKQELDPVPERIICPPSKIVVLKHIVSIEELGIDEEYQQILDDVTEMAKRFGKIIQVFIPRPHQIIDLEHAPKRVKGLGLIFIEYQTISDAKSARKQFAMKQFSGHPVSCCFFDEKRFRGEQFDIQERVIIDF